MCGSLDPDATQNEAGRYFNTRLSAPNVWEFDVAPKIIDEAAALWSELDHRAFQRHPRGQAVTSPAGDFYVVWPGAWDSDVAWVSVDDHATFDASRSMFERLQIPQRFHTLVAGHVRLFSAFFVVRSRCDHTDFHRDWDARVGNDAFTLITPLHDYSQKEQFQLSYCACKAHAAPGAAMDAELANHGTLARYEYRKGRAIAFSSQFLHGTEVGQSVEPDGQPHVYLCFTFGSDVPSRWEHIAKTVDAGQTRHIARSDGRFELSRFGQRLRESEP